MNSTRYDTVSVQGPVTVGFYRAEGRWWAVAREFSIYGSGKTRDDAFSQMSELISDYVEACVSEGTDEFFLACEKKDWDRTQRREQFFVIIVFERTTSRQKPLCDRVAPDALKSLSRFGKRFVTAGLADAACA